jgi:RNA polymerase sigma factor (TIGR02999 family)
MPDGKAPDTFDGDAPYVMEEWGNKANSMPGEITKLLRRWNRDAGAAGEADELIYAELRRRARQILRSERPGHALASSDLVNEAWLRLSGQDGQRWENRAQFFALGARMMRRILVDHARSRRRAKRGGEMSSVTLHTDLNAPAQGTDILALNDALEALAKLDPRQSQVVELRFLGGLSIEETAEALGVAKATVNRDWVTARAWLIRELSRPA